MGGDREDRGAARNGDEARGADEDVGGFDRRACRDRLEGVGDDPAGVVPGENVPAGLVPPPTSSSILPRSLPYAGGGAKVPTLGANPHFFTLASMKTNPACPRFTCTLQGPSAPIVGKRFHRLKPTKASSVLRPLRVKKTVPVRGLYPTPRTSPSFRLGPKGWAVKGQL